MPEPNRHGYASEEKGAGYAAPFVDLCTAVVLMLLAGWYTWRAFGWRSPGDWTTAPALMPVAAGLTLMLMAGGLGASAWRRRRVHIAGTGAEDGGAGAPRTILLVAIILAYILALGAVPQAYGGYLGGFYLVVGAFETVTIVTLSVVMKLFWRGPLWTCAVISLGWTAFLGLVFRNVFQIPLP